jgi:hypothetical protein
MDDEEVRLEIDERIREAVRADPAARQRIAARALAHSPSGVRGTRARAALRAPLLVAAAAVAVLGLAGWFARLRQPAPAPLTSWSITGTGSMVVVDGNDGRRWIVGRPAEPRSQGRYVIVVPQ